MNARRVSVTPRLGAEGIVVGLLIARSQQAGYHRLQRRGLDVQAADWTAGDLEGFCAVYAEDAVFISPSGKTVGRQAIFDRYTKRYREDGAEMGTLTLTVEDVRLSPAGDMASIAMRWALAWASREPASGLSLISLVRQGPAGSDGRPSWQIVQDASM